MPLTFAHPAAVLPLAKLSKRYISLTGLVIGSIVPDFEYFIRMRVLSVYSHTWLGLMWFDIPMALGLAYIYHNIVRHWLIANMPMFLHRRFIAFNDLNWNEYCRTHLLVVLYSIAIGAASHLIWDSFTHLNGYFVMAYGMARPVVVFGVNLPLYKAIQHISTVIGGMIVLAAIIRLPLLKAKPQNGSYVYWPMVLGVMVIIVALRLWFGLPLSHYPDVAVTMVSGFITGLVITPAVFRLM